nr:unnamed protein product [Callosobruchus analis]
MEKKWLTALPYPSQQISKTAWWMGLKSTDDLLPVDEIHGEAELVPHMLDALEIFELNWPTVTDKEVIESILSNSYVNDEEDDAE